jgi:hypothetical protein
MNGKARVRVARVRDRSLGVDETNVILSSGIDAAGAQVGPAGAALAVDS